MTQTGVRRVLDLAIYLAFCALAGTGFLLKWRLPPGSRGGHGWTCLGLDRHEWGDVHFCLAALVLALICLHLFLNRTWLAKSAAHGRPVWIGVGLALGAAIILAILALPVDRSAKGKGRGGPPWLTEPVNRPVSGKSGFEE
ncbi:MAG: DUF4405 domain-containing protein [Verrucomicrobia bacterium]|nr:DUF4405 domain-containing protein [Verrucomicrobiota bacterium]